MNVAETATRPSTMGVYPSSEARARVMAAYEALLARWPVAFADRDVMTRWGKTHVISAGRQGAPQLVLLHGMGCAAPLWRSVIGPLAARFQVHAVDTIGDNGKSELSDPRRYPQSGADYSQWLRDVWDGLGVDAAHVVGASMGGWIALHHAALAPRSVKRIVLLGAMGLPSWLATMRAAVKLTMARTSERRREKLIAWLCGDSSAVRDELGGWLSTTMRAGTAPKLAPANPITPTELRSIEAPTLVLLGGRDRVVGDAERVAARAKHWLRRCEVEIFPDVSHAMSIEAPALVESRITAFLTRA